MEGFCVGLPASLSRWHSPAMRPGHEPAARKLWPVVGTYGVGEAAAELTRLLRQARDVLAADPGMV